MRIKTILEVNMPNIKPEKASGITFFLSTPRGEFITIVTVGALLYTLAVSLIGLTFRFVSETIYPFSYPFLSSPLHSFLPTIIISPPLFSSLLFGGAITVAIYYFEKNIFYRRFHITIKTAFSAIAACAAVFISSIILYLSEIISFNVFVPVLYSAEAHELPILFIYYYILSYPIFSLCDALRRRLFGFP